MKEKTPSQQIKILFTDFDGTLLGSDGRISRKNITALKQLGQKEIIRVLSTGRSLFSLRRAVSAPLPFDYLAFSNGAGILQLPQNQLLSSWAFDAKDITSITAHLDYWRTDYMVHEQVPDNHRFRYKRNQRINPDFDRRLSHYDGYAQPLKSACGECGSAAQIIAILPPDPLLFQEVAAELRAYQVTRTTSPFDHTSIWMEIYPKQVSKGKSARWLCDHLGIERSQTLSIGNDYNDISLLDFTAHSYLVANGPAELRKKYKNAPSHDQDGFHHALTDAGLM